MARQPFHNQASIRRRFRKRHVRNSLLIGGVRVFVSVAVVPRLFSRDSYEIESDPQLICVAHVIMHASGPTWGCPRALPAALRRVAARDPGSRDLTRCRGTSRPGVSVGPTGISPVDDPGRGCRTERLGQLAGRTSKPSIKNSYQV